MLSDIIKIYSIFERKNIFTLSPVTHDAKTFQIKNKTMPQIYHNRISFYEIITVSIFLISTSQVDNF